MTDAVNEAMALFFALAAIQKQRLKCECATPAPGVFDPLYWTTCQRCERALSLEEFLVKRGIPEQKRKNL